MITYDEGISSLVNSYIFLDRSGTPSDGIRYILNGKVAGWVSEGLTEASTAALITVNFNQIMALMRPLGEPLTSAIKLDTMFE